MAKSFVMKVNGIEISTDHRFLLAIDILRLAKEKGAIPGKPEDYLLKGDKGTYNSDDRVDLAEDNLFITIPDKPTPVAERTSRWPAILIV